MNVTINEEVARGIERLWVEWVFDGFGGTLTSCLSREMSSDASRDNVTALWS